MNYQHTYAMIKPGYDELWDTVIERINNEGLKIAQKKSMDFTKEFADQFYEEHIGKGFYTTLQNYITSGPILALDLEGEDAIARWRTIIGPTKKEVALETAPNSLRALYARSTTENLCHGSDSPLSAIRELTLVFGSVPPEMMLHTYAMIKPGYEEVWGKIIDRIIEEGLQIIQMKTMEFDETIADNFYAEHIDKPFYPQLQAYITSGPIVAIELAGNDVIKKWREIIGPTQKEIALEKAPNSLRALYARNTTENLCHGSDSVESAVRELNIIFGTAPKYMIPILDSADFDQLVIDEIDELEETAMECKDLPTKENLRQKYLDESVMPLVLEGLSWIMKERPVDPVEHLALFLLKNNPNGPNAAVAEEPPTNTNENSRGSTPTNTRK